MKKYSSQTGIGSKIQVTVIKKIDIMKKIQLISALIVLSIFSSCSKENDVPNLDAISAPNTISAAISVKADNSGDVIITPSGEGVTQFEIYYGDGTTEPGIVNPGNSITHTFLESTAAGWPVKIVGTTLNGKTAETIIPVNVTFFAPTDLLVTIAPVPSNSLGITVKAAAEFETGFKVYFGEDPNETPVTFLQDDIITHFYTNAGTYQVKVVAITGGAASTEYTQNVTVTVPVLINLPLDFESATLPYSFTNFGGANTVVGANTHIGGINTSAKVGALTKGGGAQIWAGSFIELSNPIDFSLIKKLKMKVWGPQGNIVVKMKLENLADPSKNKEIDATYTNANSWQELTFDFASINMSYTYQRVVVFFDFGVTGNGATYFFDDIKQSN